MMPPPAKNVLANNVLANNVPDKMWMLQGFVSELPIFWEARLDDGTTRRQVDAKGLRTGSWRDLEPARVDFWGVASARGYYGFWPKIGAVMVGAALYDAEQFADPGRTTCATAGDACGDHETAFKSLSERGDPTYRRHVVLDLLRGRQETIYTEIGWGDVRLRVTLSPTFSWRVTFIGDDQNAETGDDTAEH